MGGRADPGGAWQYGRLELRDRGVFVGLQDLVFTQSLGRRGAQVACRQLGFRAGAEVIVGDNSALPGPAGVTDGVSAVLCQGSEQQLGDCEVFRQSALAFCSAEDACNVALVCSNPASTILCLNAYVSPSQRRHRGLMSAILADTLILER